MATVRANETRSTGPKWNRFPANLPFIAYVTADAYYLCVTCANGGNGSCASLTDESNPQWQIIGAQTLENHNPIDSTCAHCERRIPLQGK